MTTPVAPIRQNIFYVSHKIVSSIWTEFSRYFWLACSVFSPPHTPTSMKYHRLTLRFPPFSRHIIELVYITIRVSHQSKTPASVPPQWTFCPVTCRDSHIIYLIFALKNLKCINTTNTRKNNSVTGINFCWVEGKQSASSLKAATPLIICNFMP